MAECTECQNKKEKSNYLCSECGFYFCEKCKKTREAQGPIEGTYVICPECGQKKIKKI